MDVGDDIGAAVGRLPLDVVRDATEGGQAWVVGGVVRDLLRGVAAPTDVDIAIEGEIGPVLERLEAAGVKVEATHSRFGTATALSGGLRIDLARTRRESYPHPGSLPEVEPAAIDDDLARRDFTVNAMAVPLDGRDGLVDPTGGEADLKAGVLRVLHDSSFTDDPTRAIRAARYASRLRLEPDPETLALLEATALSTISDDRRWTELGRLAAEPTAPRGFALLAEWSVLELSAESLELIADVDARAAEAPWSSDPTLRVPAIMLVARGGPRLDAALALGATQPERPSEGVRLCAGHAPAEILTAAAAGGEWLNDFVERWRGVRLEIDGDDLLEAGIPRGPAVGAGLQGALERKLDGGLSGGRQAELELAVELARRVI